MELNGYVNKALVPTLNMDNFDTLLLERLTSDARMPKIALARELGLTEAAVRKRLRKLERSGIIVGYRAVIDYQKAGLSSSFTGVDTDPEKLWSVISKIREIPEVKFLSITAGDHTIMAEILTRSVEQLEETHRRIESLDGVRRVCPAVVVKQMNLEKGSASP